MTVIHQMLPNYAYGDGIGNCVTQMQKLLREWGHESQTFAEVIDPKVDATHYSEFSGKEDLWVIYHYSTGSPVNKFILDNCNRIILMYHNITPAKYFAPYDGEATKHCIWGREQLKPFAKAVKAAWGVSDYNKQELQETGFDSVSVVPLILNFDNIKPSGGVPKALADLDNGKTNIVFTGRVAPHKGHEDLLKVFYFYKKYVDENSRLIIVGGGDTSGLYYKSLQSLVEQMDLADVVFTGFVDDDELGDYFRLADVYLSLSRHEGFCIPLIEAMRYETPVVALAEGAVKDTLGNAGVLLSRVDHREIAELLGILKNDDEMKQSVIANQKQRATDFNLDKTSQIFKESLHSVISQAE